MVLVGSFLICTVIPSMCIVFDFSPGAFGGNDWKYEGCLSKGGMAVSFGSGPSENRARMLATGPFDAFRSGVRMGPIRFLGCVMVVGKQVTFLLIAGWWLKSKST